MTNDTKSPEDIEREIERERAGLKGSIEDLQDRFSFDGVVQQIGDQFREHGGDFSRSVAQSARDNPMALALTGVGLAWMIFGNNRSTDDRQNGYPGKKDSRASRFENDVPEFAARRGARYSGPKTAAQNQKPKPEWARDWSRDELGHIDDSSGRSLGERVSDAGASLKDAASGAFDAIADTSSSATQSVSSGAASTKQAASSAAHGISDAAGNIWGSAAHQAEALQQRFSEGTEHLSEEARERISAARARAMDARDEAARRLSQGTDQVTDFYDEHPLVVGALAFAIGAAVAGALPRTRVEDEYIGSYSDELYDEAERIYAEEAEKAQKVVKAGMDEAKNVASEVKADAESVADAALEKAQSATSRVADAVKDKVDEENLGSVKKDR